MNLFYGVFSFGLFPRQTQAMMDGNEHSREECSFSMLVDKFTALWSSRQTDKSGHCYPRHSRSGCETRWRCHKRRSLSTCCCCRY